MFIKKISPELQESIEELGISSAHGSQKKWISRIKSGLEMVAIGPENSGKTTSYIISLIQQLKEAVADVPRAMVICKDKDAVIELQERFEEFGKHTDLRFHVGFEGADIQKQKNVIYFGTDVVIGSPKRISKLLSIEGINLSDVKTLIIDDAEVIMKNDNMSYLHRITTSLPNAQKIIFSREESVNISRYSGKYMLTPTTIREENSIEVSEE
jgi:ATP-dependent RNA helicase RhlE